MQDDGAGFSGATNKIKFIRNNNTVEAFPLQSKLECAHRIFEQILFL
jgi:phosphopantothenoylcysteine synthetase/decarboxylase